jgi:ABC-type antimicrobial peptide transport system permease subunit
MNWLYIALAVALTIPIFFHIRDMRLPRAKRTIRWGEHDGINSMSNLSHCGWILAWLTFAFASILKGLNWELSPALFFWPFGIAIALLMISGLFDNRSAKR